MTLNANPIFTEAATNLLRDKKISQKRKTLRAGSCAMDSMDFTQLGHEKYFGKKLKLNWKFPFFI